MMVFDAVPLVDVSVWELARAAAPPLPEITQFTVAEGTGLPCASVTKTTIGSKNFSIAVVHRPQTNWPFPETTEMLAGVCAEARAPAKLKVSKASKELLR